MDTPSRYIFGELDASVAPFNRFQAQAKWRSHDKLISPLLTLFKKTKGLSFLLQCILHSLLPLTPGGIFQDAY
jgi:hypothetical protein